MKTLSYSTLLAIYWLLLSGHLEPLLLGLGAVSVLLTLLLVRRMNVIDHESYPLHLSVHMPAFFSYLFREIVLSNIHVAKRILTPGKNAISPQLFEIPLEQKTDLGKVIYANSITLTPGTVSLAINENSIAVHSLTKEAAESLSNGTMAKAVPDKAASH